MSDEDRDSDERDEEGGAEGPEAHRREHLNPDGLGAAAFWFPGIDDLDAIPFGGAGIWRPIGPAPLTVGREQIYMGIGPNSGEVVDIAVDPTGGDAPTLYVATGDGGLWKSLDGGTNWEPLTDVLPTAAIGAVAIDPDDPTIVYAGTGNLFEMGAGIAKAVGLWRSDDSGRTWHATDGGPHASLLAGGGIARIVCPSHDVVVVSSDNGLFLSIDGGQRFGANAPTFDDGFQLTTSFVSSLALDTGWRPARRVEDATPTTPIVVTCRAHGYRTSDRVSIGGVESNRAANGAWTVTRIDDDHFSLDGSMGNGTGAMSGFVVGPTHPRTLAVLDATDPTGANPIVVRATAHGLITGDVVAIHGVQGNTHADGSWEVRVVDADHVQLIGSRGGGGAYTNGGILDAPTHPPALNITQARNVAGAIEITVAGHGLVEHDRVTVTGLPGIGLPASSGVVHVVDANVVRIAGLHMNAPYGGVGATLSGPTLAWNTIHFARSGRMLDAVDPDRGVFRMALTSDGGVVFSRNLFANPGGPTGNYERLVIAQSTMPRPTRLLVAVQDSLPHQHVVGVFASNDAGARWSSAPGVRLAPLLTNNEVRQSFDDLTIGIDPQDRDRFYVCLKQLWRSDDAGATWPIGTHETAGGDRPAIFHDEATSPSTLQLHWDHHALTFAPATHWRWTAGAPVMPTLLYLGTDGGIARTDDAGASYVHLNDGLGTLLFNHIDIGRGAANNRATYGGMQDTGTAGRWFDAPDGYWFQGIDEDGWAVAVDPAAPDIVFAFDNGQFARTTNGGRTWVVRTDGRSMPVVVLQVRNTDPIEIETMGHSYKTNDNVTVTGIRSAGNLVGAANGTVAVTRVDDRVFRLNNRNGTTMPAFDAVPMATGTRYLRGLTVTAATLAAPIEIETATAHGLATGDRVRVLDVRGNAAPNNVGANPASWAVTVLTPTRVSLDGSDGSLSPPYVPGTGRLLPGRAGTVPIQLVTNANPVVVTALEHGFASGENVTITGVRGVAAANVAGNPVTVVDINSFRLNGVAGNGGGATFGAPPRVSGPRVGRGLPSSDTGERQRISVVPNGAVPATRVFVSIQDRLYRSDDGGISFTQPHNAPFTAPITAIASPAPDQLWIGLAARPRQGTTPARPGEVHFSGDGGVTWHAAAQHFVSVVGARTSISGIAVDPRDPDHVAVVTSGYSQTHPQRRTRHCFVTTTHGRDDVANTPAWREVGGVFGGAANLPDLPLLSVAWDGTTNPSTLLIASDGGVLRLVGNQWERVGANLPIVSCQSLAVDNTNLAAPSVVRLGTYGRSVWELVRPTGPRLVVRASLGFGERQQGTTSRLPFAVHNPGDAPLTISSFDSALGDFTVVPAPVLPLVIPAGGRQAFELAFTPSVLGARGAELTIVSSDPENGSATIRATGIGIAAGRPRLSVRDLHFGFVRVGDVVTLPLVIRNSGSADLQVTSIAFDPAVAAGANGTITFPAPPALPQSVRPGGTLSVNVQFAPTATAHAERQVAVTASGQNRGCRVDGDGTANAANLLAMVLHFFGLADEPEEVLV